MDMVRDARSQVRRRHGHGRGRIAGGAVSGKAVFWAHSFSFFPLRRFLPPFPLFLGMLGGCVVGLVDGVVMRTARGREEN